MSYEPIMVEIKKGPDNIKLYFSLADKIEEFKFEPNVFTEQELAIYKKVKSLAPLKDLKIPYTMLYSIIKNTDFGYHKGQYFYNTSYANEKYINKFINLINFQQKSGIIAYHDTYFFTKYIKLDKEYNTLFLSPSLVVSPVENFISYRKSSHLSYNDKIYFYELKNFVTKQYKTTPEEVRDKFKELYPSIHYKINETNLCDINNIDNIINNIPVKLDYIDFSSTLFNYETKNYTSYLSSQLNFNLLILSLKKLKINGLLKFQIFDLNSQLLIDIINITSLFFHKIYIFKDYNSNMISKHKNVICYKFKGIDKSVLNKLKDFSKRWFNLHPDCGMKMPKDSPYLKSIINYKKNINYFDDFNTLEIIKKIESWEKMINAYCIIKNNDTEGEEKLLLKQLRNSICWLEHYNIDTNANLKIIDENIMKENKIDDFKKLNFKIENIDNDKEIDFYNIYMYNNLLYKTFQQDKLNRIKKKLNNNLIINFIEIYEVLKIHKLINSSTNIVYDNNLFFNIIDKFIKDNSIKLNDKKTNNLIFCQSIPKKIKLNDNIILLLDIPDRPKILENQIKNIYLTFKDVYIYKSVINNLDNKIVIIAKKKLAEKKSDNDNNIAEILNNIFIFINRETNNLFFYYNNYIMLEKNNKIIEKNKTNNTNEWIKYFDYKKDGNT